jgi:hypothetical protein
VPTDVRTRTVLLFITNKCAQLEDVPISDCFELTVDNYGSINVPYIKKELNV